MIFYEAKVGILLRWGYNIKMFSNSSLEMAINLHQQGFLKKQKKFIYNFWKDIQKKKKLFIF